MSAIPEIKTEEFCGFIECEMSNSRTGVCNSKFGSRSNRCLHRSMERSCSGKRYKFKKITAAVDRQKANDGGSDDKQVRVLPAAPILTGKGIN